MNQWIRHPNMKLTQNVQVLRCRYKDDEKISEGMEDERMMRLERDIDGAQKMWRCRLK